MSGRIYAAKRSLPDRAKDGILHILDDIGNELPPGITGQVYFESDAQFSY